MILLICLVTFLVLFGSCINKTKQIHDVNKITFNNECVADLNDSFDCNYIALETNDDCLIGSPASDIFWQKQDSTITKRRESS